MDFYTFVTPQRVQILKTRPLEMYTTFILKIIRPPFPPTPPSFFFFLSFTQYLQFSLTHHYTNGSQLLARPQVRLCRKIFASFLFICLF